MLVQTMQSLVATAMASSHLLIAIAGVVVILVVSAVIAHRG